MLMAVRSFLFVVAALFLSGCGTVYSLNERYPRNKVYSGVVASWNGHATFPDIPLSFVADTVLLPYTIPRTVLNFSDPDDKWLPRTPVPEDSFAQLKLGQSKTSVQEVFGQPKYFTHYCGKQLRLNFTALDYELSGGGQAIALFDDNDALLAAFTMRPHGRPSYILGTNPCR